MCRISHHHVNHVAARVEGAVIRLCVDEIVGVVDRLEDAVWMGPTGTAYYYETTGKTIEGIPNDAQWLQYKATLISTYGCGSPKLKEVRIDL